VGFDIDAPGPEGHFGLAMMRERAQVAGGTYSVESVRGRGDDDFRAGARLLAARGRRGRRGLFSTAGGSVALYDADARCLPWYATQGGAGSTRLAPRMTPTISKSKPA
jgi:hypothetical protein